MGPLEFEMWKLFHTFTDQELEDLARALFEMAEEAERDEEYRPTKPPRPRRDYFGE